MNCLWELVLDKALITYKYQNNGWIKDSKTLKPNDGVWVKCDNNEPKAISGTPYNPNFTNLGTSWNLIGAGRDINLSELSKFSEIWAYDNKVKSWVKNPNIIPRGYGFWAK